MTKQEFRGILWWAFRQGALQMESFIVADGECLNILDRFQDDVEELVENHKE